MRFRTQNVEKIDNSQLHLTFFLLGFIVIVFFYRISLSLTKFQQVWAGATEFYWVLPGFRRPLKSIGIANRCEFFVFPSRSAEMGGIGKRARDNNSNNNSNNNNNHSNDEGKKKEEQRQQSVLLWDFYSRDGALWFIAASIGDAAIRSASTCPK